MSVSLQKKVVEKVWGMDVLPEQFRLGQCGRVGEIWFEPPPEMAEHLVKFLFTSEKLSVQVHPTGQHAEDLGMGSRGKDECWFVVAAEPGAAVALGLDKSYAPEEVRSAALNGSIEDMLVWHSARAGDFFHVPAGTIHALGPGLILLEVQQNTDITFRLFDYGRPRELHVDHAMHCAKLEPYPRERQFAFDDSSHQPLLDDKRLNVSFLGGAENFRAEGHNLLVPLAGDIEINAAQHTLGTCVLVRPGDFVKMSDNSRAAIVTSPHA